MRFIPILLAFLNLVDSSPAELVDPNCPWVLRKSDLEALMTPKPLFSDYDLSLVCISQCEHDLLTCTSTCSSSECIMECNRALVVCSDCELPLWPFCKLNQFHFQHVHVILIVLMAAKDATTLYASATWVGNINEHLINYSKDDSNADNQDACLNKTSKTLGQCILDCDHDSSCETACVSAFKDEHSECPCQVYLESTKMRFKGTP